MKAALFSLLATTLTGSATLASGRPFDAADFIALAFALVLIAWTIDQYSRKPRELTRVRPIHLPVAPETCRPVRSSQRLAA